MNKFVIGVLIIAILGSVGLFAFLNSRTTPPSQPPSPSPSPVLSETISPTNTSVMDLEVGGSSYTDEKGIFSFLYPNDYVLDTQDPNHIRIYKRNDTQRPQSEMSDGALIVF